MTDYALNYNAAAINKGSNAAIAGNPKDIVGHERITGGVVDIGAYEYQNLPMANAGKDTSICAGTFATIGKAGNPLHSYSWTSSPAGFVSSLATPSVSPGFNNDLFSGSGQWFCGRKRYDSRYSAKFPCTIGHCKN